MLIKSKAFSLFMLLILLLSCDNQETKPTDTKTDSVEVKKALEKLLLSIEQKNIDSLESLIAPNEKMELILAKTEISYSGKEFIDFHREWFKDSTWTMETKILNIEVGHPISTATTEAIYREPDRDGEPYFNHMIVTYVMEKHGDKWYVIKDHATSQKKSTD